MCSPATTHLVAPKTRISLAALESTVSAPVLLARTSRRCPTTSIDAKALLIPTSIERLRPYRSAKACRRQNKLDLTTWLLKPAPRRMRMRRTLLASPGSLPGYREICTTMDSKTDLAVLVLAAAILTDLE